MNMPRLVRLWWHPVPPVHLSEWRPAIPIEPGERERWRFVDETPPLPTAELPDLAAVVAWSERICRERQGERPDGFGWLVEHVK